MPTATTIMGTTTNTMTGMAGTMTKGMFTMMMRMIGIVKRGEDED